MRSLHDDVGHAIGFTRGSSNIGIPNKAAPSCTKAAMKSRLRIGEVERDAQAILVAEEKRKDPHDRCSCPCITKEMNYQDEKRPVLPIGTLAFEFGDMWLLWPQ